MMGSVGLLCGCLGGCRGVKIQVASTQLGFYVAEVEAVCVGSCMKELVRTCQVDSGLFVNMSFRDKTIPGIIRMIG